METGAWRCFSHTIVFSFIFLNHWDRVSFIERFVYYHWIGNFGRILHRVDFLLFLFFFRRGSLLTAIIFIYAICTPINGYFGGGMYSRVKGQNWLRQALVGAFLFPGVIFGVALTVNAVAIYYHASRAIPFLTMVS